MSHRLLAVMLASLALIAGGCGSGESESPEAETPSPSPGDATLVPSQPLAAKPNEQTKAPKKAPSASAGLIGSTDPDERAQQIQSRINAQRNGATQTASQSDPFSALSVPPSKVKLPTTETVDGTTITSLPPLPPITPQATNPLSDTPPLFVPRNETAIAQIAAGQLTVSSSSGSGSGGGGPIAASPVRGGGSGGGGPIAASPVRGGGSGGGGPIAASPARGGGSGGGGPIAASPARGGGSGGGGPIAASPARGGGSGGGGPIAASPAEPPPSASLPELPALPPEIGPALPPDEPVAALPPLDGGSLSELPPLPVEIGPALPPDEPVAALPPLDGGSVAQLPPLPVEIGPAIPPAPVEPPAVAETITITGVVQVGNEIQVIVQLPGSSTGRYVKVGDLIADGRVRIKRVDGIQGNNPIVILEEEGVEYARAVGDAPMIAMEEPDRG
jgi:hypothetical protein